MVTIRRHKVPPSQFFNKWSENVAAYLSLSYVLCVREIGNFFFGFKCNGRLNLKLHPKWLSLSVPLTTDFRCVYFRSSIS